MPTTHTQALLDTLGNWWRNLMHSRATAAEIDQLDTPELSRIAQDVGLNPPQLRTLAGKWPDAADLLSQRLAALQIDEGIVKQSEPGVMRDMQRVCSTCSEKPHCSHDIDRDPSDSEWRDYCPNLETLDALEAERNLRQVDHRHRS